MKLYVPTWAGPLDEFLDVRFAPPPPEWDWLLAFLIGMLLVFTARVLFG